MNPYHNKTAFPNQLLQFGQNLEWNSVPTQPSPTVPAVFPPLSPVVYQGETSYQFGNESNNNIQTLHQGYEGGYAQTPVQASIPNICVSPIPQNIASYQPFSSPQQLLPWGGSVQGASPHQSFPSGNAVVDFSTPPPGYPKSSSEGESRLPNSPKENSIPTANLQLGECKNEKERNEISRKFARVLEEHGSMKSTDTRILNAFIKLTPRERRLVMMHGNILAFLNNSEYINADGSTLSLAKSPEEESEASNQDDCHSEVEVESIVKEAKGDTTPRVFVSFEQIAASHNITVEKSPDSDEKGERNELKNWLSPQFDRGDPAVQKNPEKMIKTMNLIKENKNRLEERSGQCVVPLAEVGSSDFDKDRIPPTLGISPVPFINMPNERNELMSQNLKGNLQERIQIQLGDSEDETSCEMSLDESLKEDTDSRKNIEQPAGVGTMTSSPITRPPPLIQPFTMPSPRVPCPVRLQRTPTKFNPNVIEFRPRGVYMMAAPPCAYKKKSCKEAMVQTEEDVKTVATATKQEKEFTSCIMTDMLDTREVAINTVESMFDVTKKKPLLIPRKHQETQAEIKPNTCDIASEFKPFTKEIATMTDPTEMIDSVDSLQYEEAVERARNAEEKVLTLQAQMCNTELLTLSLQINLQCQPICRSPADKLLCDKILQDLQSEINRVEELYLFNILALKNGEHLNKLQAIQMNLPEGLEELQKKQVSMETSLSSAQDSTPAPAQKVALVQEKHQSLPSSPQKPPQNLPSIPRSLPTSPYKYAKRFFKNSGLLMVNSALESQETTTTMKSLDAAIFNTNLVTETKDFAQKITNIQNSMEKMALTSESNSEVGGKEKESKVLNSNVKQMNIATSVAAADGRKRYNSEGCMKSSGSESGLSEGKKKSKKKGRKKSSDGILTRAKLQEIIDQEKKNQEISSKIQKEKTSVAQNNKETSTAIPSINEQSSGYATTGDPTPMILQQTMYSLAQSNPMLATNPQLLQMKALQQMAVTPKIIVSSSQEDKQDMPKTSSSNGEGVQQQNTDITKATKKAEGFDSNEKIKRTNSDEGVKPRTAQRETKPEKCKMTTNEDWDEEADDFPQPFRLEAYNSAQEIREVPQRQSEDDGEWQIVGHKTRDKKSAQKMQQKSAQKNLPMNTKSVANSKSTASPMKPATHQSPQKPAACFNGGPKKSAAQDQRRSMATLRNSTGGNTKTDLVKPSVRVQENVGSTKGEMLSLEDFRNPGTGSGKDNEEWKEVKSKKSKNVNFGQPKTDLAMKNIPLKAESSREKKSSNFERLINRIMIVCPGTDRSGAIQLITEVRDLNHGLQGIPMAKIISDAVLITEKKKVQRMAKMEGEVCVICCDPIPQQKKKTLECGHEFHDKCIMRWLVGEERTCPTCRSHALLAEDFPKLGK